MRTVWLYVASAAAAIISTACAGPIKRVSTRPDYNTTDRTQTVRLALHTAPITAAGVDLTPMWSAIARDYTNHHRDFIVKTSTACGEGIEGLLSLLPTLEQTGEAVETSVAANLTRCSDDEEIWSAEAAATYSSADPQVSEVIRRYTELHGEAARPYVAPAFHLLRAVLDTLPKPELDEAGVMEKIELDE